MFIFKYLYLYHLNPQKKNQCMMKKKYPKKTNNECHHETKLHADHQQYKPNNIKPQPPPKWLM